MDRAIDHCANEAQIAARAAASGRRAHHRCSVDDGCPCRIDFSRAASALIAAKGSATSISFGLYPTTAAHRTNPFGSNTSISQRQHGSRDRAFDAAAPSATGPLSSSRMPHAEPNLTKRPVLTDLPTWRVVHPDSAPHLLSKSSTSLRFPR